MAVRVRFIPKVFDDKVKPQQNKYDRRIIHSNFFYLVLKLVPDKADNDSDNDRAERVQKTRKDGDFHGFNLCPVFRFAHGCDREPVIWNQRMGDAEQQASYN